MKITSTTIARSLIGDTVHLSTSSRDARERMQVDTSTEKTRVHVEMYNDGSATITTFKRAEGATAADTDAIAWIEDTAITLYPGTKPTVIGERSLAF